MNLEHQEGTGFDLMYDIQLSLGRSVPVPVERMDSVVVTVGRRVQRPAAIRLMADADARFQLRQRERITLGLLAASEGLTARELATRLELSTTDELRPGWMGRLLDFDLVRSTGKTQAVRYFINPDWLKKAGLDSQTTLRRMEPHRLRALIVEDLTRYPESSSGDIRRRTCPELDQKTVKRALDELTKAGHVRHAGEKRGRRYWLIDQ